MATGFKIPDGRDLSDIFGSGSRGSAVGFQTSNGTDLGYQFASGSTGIITGMQNSAGIDLGSLFGPPAPPAPYTMTIGRVVTRTDDDEWDYIMGFRSDHRLGQTFGKMNYVPSWEGCPLAGLWCEFSEISNPYNPARDTSLALQGVCGINTITVNGAAMSSRYVSGGFTVYTANGDALKLKEKNGKKLTLTFSPSPTGYS